MSINFAKSVQEVATVTQDTDDRGVAIFVNDIHVVTIRANDGLFEFEPLDSEDAQELRDLGFTVLNRNGEERLGKKKSV